MLGVVKKGHRLCRHWKQEAAVGRWVLREGRQALTGSVGKTKSGMQEDKPHCSRYLDPTCKPRLPQK